MNNKKGIALIMAVSTLALLITIAMEVMYDSNVEYLVNSQAMNRMKAYYAAKAGIDISLLRIKIFQQINQKMGKNAAQIPFLDQIWKFPLVWPVDIPDNVSSIEKDDVKKAIKSSIMDATFRTDIEDEGSKFDINDLASASKTLNTAMQKQILQIFETELKENDEFRNKYSSFKFAELVGSIADWMSSKKSSVNGGDKSAPYQVYKTKGFPPNRGFRTLQELRLVNGMTDEFYSLLEPKITIYGLKGINPNNASKEVLMALDPGITAEIAKKIIEHIQDPKKGPFKGGADGIQAFWDFVTKELGARLEQDTKNIPIVLDTMVSFKISSTGIFANTSQKITAIVMDLNLSAQRTSDYIKKDKEDPNAAAPAPAPTDPAKGLGSQKQNDPLPKGPPRIVYWAE